MLQQTRMEVVLGYFVRFLQRFPTLADLAQASDHEVMAAWSGLGYYRRARMLRAGAEFVMTHFGGVIPRDADQLQRIPGIGRYTAGAIASVAFDERAPIVDGNVTRITARIFADENPWHYAQQLVSRAKSPRALNQGLMELGALVCTPRNPSCLICPVRRDCAALAQGRVDEFPRPKEKPATRELRIPLYVISDRKGRVLMRLERGPLMSSMYHLPHGDTQLLPGEPLAAERREKLGKVRHTVTTRKIEFEVWRAELAKQPRAKEWRWIAMEELSEVPHPSYVRKALALLSS